MEKFRRSNEDSRSSAHGQASRTPEDASSTSHFEVFLLCSVVFVCFNKGEEWPLHVVSVPRKSYLLQTGKVSVFAIFMPVWITVVFLCLCNYMQVRSRDFSFVMRKTLRDLQCIIASLASDEQDICLQSLPSAFNNQCKIILCNRGRRRHSLKSAHSIACLCVQITAMCAWNMEATPSCLF